jgi:hypothetical protein
MNKVIVLDEGISKLRIKVQKLGIILLVGGCEEHLTVYF